MPTFSATLPVEGDALLSTTMNALFTGLQNDIAALDETSVERFALRGVHMPPMLEPTTRFAPEEYEAMSPVAAHDTHKTYTNSLPVLNGGTSAETFNLQAFSAAAGPLVAPYGTTAAPNAGGGWRILAHSAVADAAEISLSAAASLDTMRFKGILARLRVEIWDGNIATIATSAQTQAVQIGIGIEDGAGTRYVIERSVRSVPIASIVKGAVSTFTVIQQADLQILGLDGTLSKIFGVIAGGVMGQYLGATTITNPEVRMYNLSVVPLHAGDLEL